MDSIAVSYKNTESNNLISNAKNKDLDLDDHPTSVWGSDIISDLELEISSV